MNLLLIKDFTLFENREDNSRVKKLKILQVFSDVNLKKER